MFLEIIIFVIFVLILLEIISAPIEWLWPCSMGGSTVWRGDKHQKVVSLTFDDGPSEYTDEILDILKRRKIHATFFVIGSNVHSYVETVKRIVSEGHEIGNHTFSFQSKRWILKFFYPIKKSQVYKNQEILKEISGKNVEFYRSPGLQMGRGLLRTVHSCNLKVINGTFPFPNPRGDSDHQLKVAMKSVKPGAIVILHDGDDHNPGSKRPKATVSLLPLLLDHLDKQGYEVKPLSYTAH